MECSKNNIVCNKILELTTEIQNLIAYGLPNDESLEDKLNNESKAKLEIIKRLTANVLDARDVTSKQDKEIQELKSAIEKLGQIINIAVIQWDPIRDNTENINKILEDTIGKKLSDCG
jgi:hypothetical protein